jgi:hypothetical protein
MHPGDRRYEVSKAPSCAELGKEVSGALVVIESCLRHLPDCAERGRAADEPDFLFFNRA